MITLTEQDIHNLVKESLVRTLMNEGYTREQIEEGFFSNLKGAFKPVGQVAGQAMNQVGNSARQKLNTVGNAIGNTANKVGQAVGNAANKVGQTAKSGGQMMKAGWQNAKLQGYKQDAINALNKYLQYAKGTIGAGDKTVNYVQQCIKALSRNANVGNSRVGAYRNDFQRNIGMNTAN